MQKLNLPLFDIKVKEEEDKKYIYDIIRKKFFLLTPEEWVRQHFLHLLILHYQYPKSLIKIESGLRYNSLLKRSDIIIYDRSGNPFMLVECKSADQKISQNIFTQGAMYNMTVQAPYLVVTNGLNHYCCKIDHGNKSYEFMNDIPVMP